MTQQRSTFVQEPSEARSRHAWIARFLAGAVGIVLLVAGVLKAVDLELFIRQIGDYGIIYERVILVVSAWGMIVLECGLGAGLLVLYRPRVTLPLAALLFLVFAGATGWAWLTGNLTSSEKACGRNWGFRPGSPGETRWPIFHLDFQRSLRFGQPGSGLTGRFLAKVPVGGISATTVTGLIKLVLKRMPNS